MRAMEAVLALLVQRGDCPERLALLSHSTMRALLDMWLSRTTPICLMQAMRPCQALCVRWAVQRGYPLLTPVQHSLSSVRHLCNMYAERLKGKLALACGTDPAQARFTFHLVTRFVPTTGRAEAALHRFICFAKARPLIRGLIPS